MTDRDLDAAQRAAVSGAGSGAILGGVTSLIAGAKKPRELLLRMLAAGAGGGALAGGSTYLGSKMLGTPDEDENHAYTRRGAVGGALGGGALGAGAGALVASGAVSPSVDNLVVNYFKSLAKKPSLGHSLRGALLGSLAGAVVGGYQAGDEGMQVDLIEDEMKKAKLRGALGG